MKLEDVILVTVPSISILSLLFIPKNKLFQAQFIFVWVQVLTWIFGISIVQLGLIEYPYRELSTVNRTSFIFEFLVLPILCVNFNAYFPERSSKTVKCLYYIGFTLLFTVLEYFLEKYTLIIRYTGWKLYMTFISECIIYWLSRRTTRWFFKGI